MNSVASQARLGGKKHARFCWSTNEQAIARSAHASDQSSDAEAELRARSCDGSSGLTEADGLVFFHSGPARQEEEEESQMGGQTNDNLAPASAEQLVISSSGSGRMLFLTRLALGDSRIGLRQAGETIWPLGSANETEPASELASQLARASM